MSNILRLNSPPRMNLKSNSKIIEEERREEIVPVKKQIEEAYAKGIIDGQQMLKLELDREYSDKLYKKYEEVYHILEDFDKKLKEYEQSFERLVVGTSVELARKIIQKEVKDQSIINDVVKEAISKVIGANEVRIKFHPDDMKELNTLSRNLINSSSFSKIKFEEDEKIEKGGCLVETEIGNVDARISTQLEELRRKLEESIDNG
ncbi:MAG: FliH/SctL family protein [Bacteroidota bacterium]